MQESGESMSVTCEQRQVIVLGNPHCFEICELEHVSTVHMSVNSKMIPWRVHSSIESEPLVTILPPLAPPR